MRSGKDSEGTPHQNHAVTTATLSSKQSCYTSAAHCYPFPNQTCSGSLMPGLSHLRPRASLDASSSVQVPVEFILGCTGQDAPTMYLYLYLPRHGFFCSCLLATSCRTLTRPELVHPCQLFIFHSEEQWTSAYLAIKSVSHAQPPSGSFWPALSSAQS